MTARSCGRPQTPSRLMPVDGAVSLPMDAQFAELSWADTARAESYEVYFGTTRPPPFVDDVTTGMYALPPLAPNTTYYWQIVAINDAGSAASPVHSLTSTNNRLTQADLVLVPAGSFEMGDIFYEGEADEWPVHTVYVDAFQIDVYEITYGQYIPALNWAYHQGDTITVTPHGHVQGHDGETILYVATSDYMDWPQIAWNGRGFRIDPDRANHPIVELDWYGAAAYCNWRSAMEGRTPCYDLGTWECDFAADGYRLPTEAEWEKAARGGVAGHRFPWSDTDTIQHDRANYASYASYYDTSPTCGLHPDFRNADDLHTGPVGQFAPNGYGLYDMAGNAAEWCNDWYDENYYDTYPADAWPPNPCGPASGYWRVLRGGHAEYNACYSRVAARSYQSPDECVSNGYHGFRCVTRTK